MDCQHSFNIIFKQLAERYSPVRVVRLRDTGVASGGAGIDDEATKEFCLAQRALAQSRVTGKLDEFLSQASAGTYNHDVFAVRLRVSLYF